MMAEREGFYNTLFRQLMVKPTVSDSRQCLQGVQACLQSALLFPQFPLLPLISRFLVSLVSLRESCCHSTDPLLQLASVPFDKQDETLVPEAGSCANCPKRTGFNKLLFPDVQKDSCIDAQCFRHKLDVHISKTLESKPKLVQISSAWNSREGAPLGRNHYVELQIKKAKTNWILAEGEASRRSGWHFR
jgi:hypothetical protein